MKKKFISLFTVIALLMSLVSALAGTASADGTGTDYYLFGYINGANYACEEDSANLGEYKFTNGELTVRFDVTSYVAVKTSDNANWYMTDGWQGAVDSVTLYNNSGLKNPDKLMVPGEVTVKFTLTENADGTLTLSYKEVPEEGAYYLFGMINGADYGCGGDYENVGKYKFENGVLTVRFNAESSVAVKSSDNANWYMTDGTQEGIKNVTLHNMTTLGVNAGMLTVPGNVTLQFTMTDNGNDTFTLSYEEIENTYYLFGYINGMDYACNADSEKFGIYKFTDGKLTARFDKDSYVAVKSSDNANWYMTNGWQGEVNSVTLYNNSGLENPDKLMVPGNITVEFTLVENVDGTLTLSYEEVPEESAYYLFGMINGEDYGCEGDFERIGDYKFVDGELTARFSQESSVAVKTADNVNWYMTDGPQGEVTSVILRKTSELGLGADKLKVPGGVDLKFTLVENADGTLTLSYEKVPGESSTWSSENVVLKKIIAEKTQDGSAATAVLSKIDLNGTSVTRITWTYAAGEGEKYKAEYEETELSGESTVYFGIVVPALLEVQENQTTGEITVNID